MICHVPIRASPTCSACTCAGAASRLCAAPARIRPALPLRYRLIDPREHAVFLGRAHYRHRLHVPLEEHLLVMAPPRTYKTAFLADVILRYPGPVIATTTKADIFTLTAAVRSFRGPVSVFNPQHIGGVPSTFCWSPVEGCQDPATAIRRADAFAFAVSQKGVEDGTFWSAKASDYLRGYFCAAALAQYDLRAVAAWVSGADPDVPERILAAAGAHQWALTLAELRSEAHKTAATVRMVMSRALSFMADPDLAACVLPAPGTGFSIPAFLRDAGTVYMIAEAVSEEAPVAPPRPGGSSAPTAGGSRSPGCAPGSSRSTGPATGTSPRPSPPAGPPTTCACTAWTCCPACGRCSTSSLSAPPGCCPPRPNTRPASCPPWPPSWVAAQPEGNRNAGLFWAANRALEADPAADLSLLATAARQAGLGDQEIKRTLDSARRTGHGRPNPPDYQAEAVN